VEGEGGGLRMIEQTARFAYVSRWSSSHPDRTVFPKPRALAGVRGFALFVGVAFLARASRGPLAAAFRGLALALGGMRTALARYRDDSHRAP
jgi:hypothetical protein